jgi:hypothetical protein
VDVPSTGPLSGLRSESPRVRLRPAHTVLGVALVLAFGLSLWGCSLLLVAYQYVDEVRPGASEAARRAPVDPGACDALRPTVRDKDAGLVGIVTAFQLASYSVLEVDRFGISNAGISGLSEESGHAATALFQADVMRDLQRYRRRQFRLIVAPGEPPARVPAGDKGLRLETQITKMSYASGESVVQVETCLRDARSGAPMMVTATRRAHRNPDATAAILGGLNGIMTDLNLLLDRLLSGGAVGPPPSSR